MTTTATPTTVPTTATDGLRAATAALVADGRGVLAADESPSTMSQRLKAVGVPPTEEHRRAYRELLVTAEALATDVSGVILCDETVRQRLADGRAFPVAIAEAGLATGIKVDTGTEPLDGADDGETITRGLDGLAERVAEYAVLGARFAKWRAVLHLGAGRPSSRALEANAEALARYARTCQDGGLVPIVEPELLAAGGHRLEVCAAATARTLATLARALEAHGVDPAAMVLKPNMVTAGEGSRAPAGPGEVARATVDVLRATMPTDLAGVAFLSGGQSSETAAANLAAIRRRGGPWPLTFSFGRALVSPALHAWRGDPTRVGDGRAALLREIERVTS
ncbi:fructose-bisphosphate aldolase [Actinomycetospora sp. NBRC 106375]|uniref:class I fructose-bisphosphate aldolase n=1 Tax=Actinomycetospora sp. NBRC 106375 TaxID=3032207 RepID=UPI0024A383DB|nr:class I fructose-bisphosphate aldolase [Actinomycetospora sp. NBRC 106375]GLZ45635.1 fructose-bisphosphate aldolase [Actinomycetospora sp. NBRC 106375]